MQLVCDQGCLRHVYFYIHEEGDEEVILTISKFLNLPFPCDVSLSGKTEEETLYTYFRTIRKRLV